MVGGKDIDDDIQTQVPKDDKKKIQNEYLNLSYKEKKGLKCLSKRVAKG